MKAEIGMIAGRIWEALYSHGETAMSRIPGLIGEKAVDVYQALGWLAREDKIEYRTLKSKTFVSVTNK